MPRYIDADTLVKAVKSSMESGTLYLPIEFCELIETIPTADAVEVVRCKDCMFWDITSPMATVIPVPCRCGLRRASQATIETDFCSYAERREETDNE